ncbi:MAG: DUF1499 domain-containing protein [Deltaproteobacteria bacterium]|nr:DUF1499 domain-containing protein [Deltaproteobacteria bacterium]MCB9786302.1 DUF1499 domain-containing protein [Deltaproteobacteria bacterium]
MTPDRNPRPKPSRAEALARRSGPLALSLFVASPLLAMTGLVPPLVAFRLLAPALLLALLALGASIVLLVRGPRRRALMPLATAVPPLLVVAGFLVHGAGHPLINDVTTDTADPPAFDASHLPPELADADLTWPEPFTAQVRAAYPQLETFVTDRPAPEVLAAAEATARAMDLDIRHVDPAAGRIEATARSALFHFRDDVLVRVRPRTGGAVAVDLRSRSRVGKGDLGANAARIQTFLERLRQRLSPR